MRRSPSTPLTALLACLSCSSAAHAFQIDATPAQVQQLLSRSTVADLAPGDVGLIRADRAVFCVEQGALRLSGTTQVVSEPSEVEILYDVERLDDEAVDLALSEAGKAPGPDSPALLVERIAGVPQCEALFPSRPLLDVQELLGASKLTQLLDGAATPAAREEPEIDNWSIVEGVSPTGGLPRVLITTESLEGPDTTLVLRCRDGRTDVYMVTDRLLGLGTSFDIAVELRIDDGIARKETAVLSRTRQSIFLKNPIAKAFLLSGGVAYTMKFQDHAGIEQTVTFNITSLETLLPRLRNACEW